MSSLFLDWLQNVTSQTTRISFLRINAAGDRSHLPGLSSAGSIRSGLFVAPITNNCEDFWRPSNSANSCEMTLSITPPESPLLPRFGAKESSSSKKIMHGTAARALLNTRTHSITRWYFKSPSHYVVVVVSALMDMAPCHWVIGAQCCKTAWWPHLQRSKCTTWAFWPLIMRPPCFLETFDTNHIP